MHRRAAVFLDLNGTLAEPVEVERLADLTMIKGAADAVALLCQAGFLCPVVTVQSKIEKGVFSEFDFLEWFRKFAQDFAAIGAELKGPYICAHRFATPCVCAKPQTLLYKRAAAELGIDLIRSFSIGDTSADVEAAHRFGGHGCLVRTGYAAGVRNSADTMNLATYTGDTLQQVALWIVRRPR